ncbi:hypothetical protein B5F74_11635 [Collinsella sp. An271]|uniref:hypothetical protein n=1 Tax=Collinsella sp. An271 TaxID=1965616 RepID=UPI000B39EA07|nr:hypothetical protein [Collinsella sp. An271]OUO57826.1 hypothetical protein B5F74_11635 [Collinsella sp. An271]
MRRAPNNNPTRLPALVLAILFSQVKETHSSGIAVSGTNGVDFLPEEHVLAPHFSERNLLELQQATERLLVGRCGHFALVLEGRELAELAGTRDDFTEENIEARTAEIIDSFVDYLGEAELLSD